jgi:hypothetical protein
VERRFAGIAPFAGTAALFAFIGVLTFLLEIQSPSFVQWHGIRVKGDTYGGVTTYHYGGQAYSIDNRNDSASDRRHIPTTVWLPYSDPTNPERAYLENPYNRWTDFAFVVTPWAVAVVILSAGVIWLEVRRRRRDVRALTNQFGTGLSPDVVERILAERRSGPRR